jgi:energy-coupling factor transporter ATP-binding protein EcfA2
LDFVAGGILSETAQVGSDNYALAMHGTRFEVTIGGVLRAGGEGAPNSSLLGYRGDVSAFSSITDFVAGITHVDPFRNVNAESPVGRTPAILPSGSNLAQVLHNYYVGDRDRFDAYEEAVKQVLPEIDIVETPLTPQGATVTVSLRFIGSSLKYDLREISSGIKDVLVLIAAALFSSKGALLVVEEPENHLHPAAQKALCSVIKRLATSDDKQFVLITHSDFVLRQFAPEQCYFMDRSSVGSKATVLTEVDAYGPWERLGLDNSSLFEVLGRGHQVLVIVEGRTDTKTLEGLWRDMEMGRKAVPVRSSGGGWEEIVASAAALRDAFQRFRIPTEVFVLLDNDGRREEKLACLEDHGFDSQTGHVWSEKEIESYLIMPKTLGSIAGKDSSEVEHVIANSRGQGKARLGWILNQLGIPDTPMSTIITNACRTNPEEIHEELRELTKKVATLLGLPK